MDLENFRGGSELLPRYLLLEPLLKGRRVLEVGALGAIGTLGAELCLERGARAVVSVGSLEDLAGHARPDLPAAIELHTLDEVPAEDRFDVIVLHDAAALLTPGGTASFRERLAPGGRLMAVALNAHAADLNGPVPTGGPGYSELVAQLSQSFLSVQVVLQSPLLGYTLVPYGVENPDTAVDGTLAGAVEPSHYLLLCGQEPLVFDELSLVALPAKALLQGRAATQPADRSAEAAGRTGTEAQLTQQLLELEDTAQQLREALAAAEATRAERDSWVAGLRHEIEERDTTLTWREQEARAAAVDAATARKEAEAYREDRDHARRQLTSRAEELAGALARAKASETDLRQMRGQLERLQHGFDEAEAGRAAAEARARSTLSAAERLEQETGNALATISKLQAELAEANAASTRGARALDEAQAALDAAGGREAAWLLESQRQAEELSAIETSRRSLTAEVTIRNERLAQITAELAAQRATAAARLTEVEGDLVAVVNAKEVSEAQLTQTRLRLREMERLPTEFAERDQRARATADGLRQELAEARGRAEQVAAQVELLRTSEAELRDQLAAEAERSRQAVDDASIAAERAAELQRHSEEGRARAARLERDIHTLASAESQGRARAEAAEAQGSATAAALGRLQESLETARTENARLRREAEERHAEARRTAKTLEEARGLLEKTNETLAAERGTTREAVEKLGRIEELARAAQARADHAETEALLREKRIEELGQELAASAGNAEQAAAALRTNEGLRKALMEAEQSEVRVADELRSLQGSSQGQIEQLQRELSEERDRARAVSQERATLAAAAEQAQQSASNSVEAKRRSLEELAASRDQQESLRAGQEGLRAEIDRLRSGIAAAEAAASGSAGLAAEVDRLKAELVAAQQQRLQAIRTAGDWGSQAEIGSWKSEADRLRDLLAKASTDLELALRNQAASHGEAEQAPALRAERDRLEAALATAQNELRQMASLPAAMMGQSLDSAQLEEMSDSAGAANDELGALRARANDREEKLEELRRVLANRTERIARLVSELGDLRGKNSRAPA
jgi:chromosome segregation ATPase